MSTESQPINSAPVVENEAKNVEDPKKVFAGNLAFSTTEAEVKEMFSVAGTVTDVSLITRGTRSLGYGFVTFSTEAEAKKAAEILNKKEVGGREINVESARPQNSAPGAAANGLKKKSNNKKKATGPRARRPRNEQGEEGGETAAESATEGAAGATGETKSAKKRNKKAAAKKEVAEAADGALAAEVEGKAKKPITKRQPRPKVAPTGEPSKTTLFVSNLSWSIDDEKLKTIFGSYKVRTATVIRHKYGNQRSKGFGFVDFESEEEQQKALNNEQGKIHDEREIHMRVALVNDKKDEESKPAEETAANPAVETPLAA